MFNPRAWIILPLTVLAACGASSIRVTTNPGPSTSPPPATVETTSTTTTTTVPAATSTVETTTTVLEVAAAAEIESEPVPGLQSEPEIESVPSTTVRKTTTSSTTPAADAYTSMEPCGGDLPPCEVKRRESGGNYRAINRSGCGGRGCYGAWQFDPRTWSGMGFPGRPDQADPDMQDEAARILWADGAGCRAWSGPNWNGCMFR